MAILSLPLSLRKRLCVGAYARACPAWVSALPDLFGLANGETSRQKEEGSKFCKAYIRTVKHRPVRVYVRRHRHRVGGNEVTMQRCAVIVALSHPRRVELSRVNISIGDAGRVQHVRKSAQAYSMRIDIALHWMTLRKGTSEDGAQLLLFPIHSMDPALSLSSERWYPAAGFGSIFTPDFVSGAHLGPVADTMWPLRLPHASRHGGDM